MRKLTNPSTWRATATWKRCTRENVRIIYQPLKNAKLAQKPKRIPPQCLQDLV